MHAGSALLSALSLSLFLCTAPASAASKAPDVHEVDREEIDKVRCDKTSELDVNYGDTLNFNASFTARDGAAVKVTNVKYWFWADQDYNASDPPITFTGTKEFMDGGIITVNTETAAAAGAEQHLKADGGDDLHQRHPGLYGSPHHGGGGYAGLCSEADGICYGSLPYDAVL